MNQGTKALCYLSVCCALTGCSSHRETSGEMFSHDSKGAVVKESGTVIHFLTPDQHEAFEAAAKGARDRLYQHDKEAWEKCRKEYTELYNKSKPQDGDPWQADIVAKLNDLQAIAGEAKTNIEEKVYDRRIHFDD